MRTLDCEEDRYAPRIAIRCDRYNELLAAEANLKHVRRLAVAQAETARHLLESLTDALAANRRVRELAEYWRSQGATSLPNMLIATLEGKEVDQW